MIQKYYDLLTKIENIVDGLMIVDENCVIQYNKQFNAMATARGFAVSGAASRTVVGESAGGWGRRGCSPTSSRRWPR